MVAHCATVATAASGRRRPPAIGPLRTDVAGPARVGRCRGGRGDAEHGQGGEDVANAAVIHRHAPCGLRVSLVDVGAAPNRRQYRFVRIPIGRSNGADAGGRWRGNIAGNWWRCGGVACRGASWAQQAPAASASASLAGRGEGAYATHWMPQRSWAPQAPASSASGSPAWRGEGRDQAHRADSGMNPVRGHRVLSANRIPRERRDLGRVARSHGKPMPDREPVPAIADETPWSERLTDYDDRHVETYARLLEADNEGLAKDDIARRILGIDPDAEPGRACKAVESHITRARWMGEVGYLLLAAGDYPGDGRDERDEAGLLEFLPSIGITLAPRGGTGGGGS